MRLKQLVLSGLLIAGFAIHTQSVGVVEYKEVPATTDVLPDKEFTETEKMNVHVTTPEMFDGTNVVAIDLSKIKRGDWCYPLRDGKLISPFGGARHHSGIDIKTYSGDTVYAAFSGRVRFSKPCSGYGNVVVLRHSTGMETYYSHNTRNLVRIGDVVKAGDPIAIEGRTGRATTHHVHFEVRINGKAYDPARFFDPRTCCLRSIRVLAYKSGKIETENVIPANNLAEDNMAEGAKDNGES